ncbi:hypothetical protein [Desulfobulbus sp.]|uniref:hypothetical protein n=1 Tax=Desulfobulbus sp. TaxID=895 RepID=UPI00286F522C|nr:hypothetical protein [Desulfobulbus sp.]
MQIDRRKINALVMCVVMMAGLAGKSAMAEECEKQPRADPGTMTADAAVVRPVGTVATVAGFALFLISSPFAAMGGNTHEAWESLVAEPANYTFKRPLGHFDCEPQAGKKK